MIVPPLKFSGITGITVLDGKSSELAFSNVLGVVGEIVADFLYTFISQLPNPMIPWMKMANDQCFQLILIIT